MGITGLAGIRYGVAGELDVAARFLEEFGLRRVEGGEQGAVFATPEGATIELRAAGDAGLPAPAESGSTAREVVWAVSSPAALEAIAAELEGDRAVTRDADGRLHSVDPIGQGIAFEVDRRQALADEEAPPRQNTRARLFERAAPSHLGHLGFHTQHLDELREFYTRRLGFRVTDTIVGAAVFLRGSDATNHHNIFLVRGPHDGLNHVSFRVRNYDEVMGGHEFLAGRGWRALWGPGRHRIGSDLFTMFANPCGGMIEYHADEDVITDPDAWQPGEWDPRQPGVFAAWGPPPPPQLFQPGGMRKLVEGGAAPPTA